MEKNESGDLSFTTHNHHSFPLSLFSFDGCFLYVLKLKEMMIIWKDFVVNDMGVECVDVGLKSFGLKKKEKDNHLRDWNER